MYFLDIESLKSELRDKTIDDEDLLSYVIWGLALGVGTWNLRLVQDSSEPRVDILLFCLLIFINLCGISWALRQHPSLNLGESLRAFFALSWVVSWRMVVVVGLLATIIVVGASFISRTAVVELLDFMESMPVQGILDSSVSIFFFWRIGVHLKDSAQS